MSLLNNNLTKEEEELVQKTSDVFNHFNNLPETQASDLEDFKAAIRTLQRIIIARPTLRILKAQKKLVYK